MVRFVQCAGCNFRVLLDDPLGAWLINYDEPAAPFRVCTENLGFKRIETPASFLRYFDRDDALLSPAEQSRLELIVPLLQDPNCIRNKALRLRMSEQVAQENHTTQRRVLRIYYRYLATGILTENKKREVRTNDVFEWAIETFYFSSKKFSLRAAFEMMVAKKFTDETGTLCKDCPSWYSFQHYYYRRLYHRSARKMIAREGLSCYARNYRPLTGTEDAWRKSVGAYQMDATQADIYLVSSVDRSQVVGRPNIYLAVDTASRVVTGFYVGFSAGECAVAECLAQAAEDKVAYCARHGIHIRAEQWPSAGLPSEVITDKGRDFCGQRMQEMCMRYGIEMQSLPPFRPDEKGLVEKTFDLLQQRYKPMLRGSGIIEADSRERWATDYREQAVLDLEEFRRILIYCIINLNEGRLLNDGCTPSERWGKLDHELLEAESNEVYRMALERKQQKLTRRGFYLQSVWYAPGDRSLLVGESYTVAYSPDDIRHIFVVQERGWIECKAVSLDADGPVVSDEEATLNRRTIRERKKSASDQTLQRKVAMHGSIERVLRDAKGD